MASFKICIRNRRKDGLWPVYLRLVHNRKPEYIRTNLMVNAKGITKNGEVKDAFVIKRCMEMIEDFAYKLNGKDVGGWTALQIKRFLAKGDDSMSFSDFAKAYIAKLVEAGGDNNAKLYSAAMKSLHVYAHNDNICFQELSRDLITGWITYLSGRTKRARTLYPICVRQIFRDALLSSQEQASQIATITSNPWNHITIPTSVVPRKRAVTPDLCRRFFAYELENSCKMAGKAQLGRDVAMLSFCLAGINTVDLYKLRKCDLKDGVLRYCRSKTASRRKDGAYFEMRVGPLAARLIAKYKSGDGDESLLAFAKRYSSAKVFNVSVNQGIKTMCGLMGLEKDEYLTFYSFRHTWATVARNNCGASLSEIGFAMNHLQSDSVTRGYIKIDFSPAWRLNEKVIDFVLSGDAPARGIEHEQQEEDGLFRLSPKMLIRAAAFFQGKCIANFEDIGYSNFEEVTKALADRFPENIPNGSMVQVKIVDCDNGKVYAYEHEMGKGGA